MEGTFINGEWNGVIVDVYLALVCGVRLEACCGFEVVVVALGALFVQ